MHQYSAYEWHTWSTYLHAQMWVQMYLYNACTVPWRESILGSVTNRRERELTARSKDWPFGATKSLIPVRGKCARDTVTYKWTQYSNMRDWTSDCIARQLLKTVVHCVCLAFQTHILRDKHRVGIQALYTCSCTFGPESNRWHYNAQCPTFPVFSIKLQSIQRSATDDRCLITTRHPQKQADVL